MSKRALRSLGPVVGFILFAVALWVLRGELRHHHYHEIVTQLRSLPGARLVLAILLAATSYLLLTGYDTLGLRYAHCRLPYRRTALASFVGYAFSNTIGH